MNITYNKKTMNCPKLNLRTIANTIDDTESIQVIICNNRIDQHIPHSQAANSTRKAGSSRANCDLLSENNRFILCPPHFNHLRFLYWKFLYTFWGAMKRYSICQAANWKSI